MRPISIQYPLCVALRLSISLRILSVRHRLQACYVVARKIVLLGSCNNELLVPAVRNYCVVYGRGNSNVGACKFLRAIGQTNRNFLNIITVIPQGPKMALAMLN